MASATKPYKQPAKKPPARDGRAPTHSDDQLAVAFVDRHHDELRYTAASGRWHRWTGARWVSDDTLAVTDLVRGHCRDASGTVEKTSAAIDLASARTISAVERLARADRRIAATPDQFDRDGLLLNTPAGVVDLRTGELRPHRPADMMSKITAAEPDDRDPELWEKFLATVTGGDPDLVLYLQRAAGYCLTASVREHALFFLHGTGANGKSVFTGTIAGIMGDYATEAPSDMFMAARGERHPTELAGLRGARLVLASETEDGRRWNAARVKGLTGGDKISARFVRGDFFVFAPTFKVMIAGNHKPALRSVDEAIRRRLHMIPFAITIEAGTRDPDLAEKLRKEDGAILSWAIRGAVDWGGEGLRPPEAVWRTTDEYMAGEDRIGRWIEDRAVLDRHAAATTAALFNDWKSWAEGTGEYVGSQRRFAQVLAERPGLVRWRCPRTDARGFRGIVLRQQVTPQAV